MSWRTLWLTCLVAQSELESYPINLIRHPHETPRFEEQASAIRLQYSMMMKCFHFLQTQVQLVVVVAELAAWLDFQCKDLAGGALKGPADPRRH